LNLRPHAYQAGQPVLENRHRDGLSLRRSSIRRLSADIDAGLLNAERDHQRDHLYVARRRPRDRTIASCVFLQFPTDKLSNPQLGMTTVIAITRTNPRATRERRWLVEECRRISVARLLKVFGKPKSSAKPVPLRFKIVGGHKLAASIVATSQHLGERWWIICPCCDRRASFLYSPRPLAAPNFACRRCWNLGYQSQLACRPSLR